MRHLSFSRDRRRGAMFSDERRACSSADVSILGSGGDHDDHPLTNRDDDERRWLGIDGLDPWVHLLPGQRAVAVDTRSLITEVDVQVDGADVSTSRLRKGNGGVKMENGGEDEEEKEEVEEIVWMRGRVGVKRVMSKRLSFVDLAPLHPVPPSPHIQIRLALDREQPPASKGSQDSGMTQTTDATISSHCLDGEEYERSISVFKDARVGDVVEIGGVPERTRRGTLGLAMRRMRCIEAWKDSPLAAQGFHFAPLRRLPSVKIEQDPPNGIDGVNNNNEAAISDVQQLEISDEKQAIETTATIAPLCKFWRRGECKKGDACKYRHRWISSAEKATNQRLRSERDARREEEADADDPFPHGKLPRTRRAKIFCEWLVKEFGLESLRQGTGVVDVAGGLGHLSFELSATHRVPCLLIDPREAKLSKKQQRELKRRTIETANAQAPESVTNERQSRPYQQLTELFEPSLWNPHDKEHSEHQQAVRRVLLGASVVVGLHPDQATEAIVDFALEQGKGFAIVPCCVFPGQFSERKLDTGEPVISYLQFVRYLVNKSPDIRIGYLPMEGRNKVLYRKIS